MKKVIYSKKNGGSFQELLGCTGEVSVTPPCLNKDGKLEFRFEFKALNGQNANSKMRSTPITKTVVIEETGSRGKTGKQQFINCSTATISSTPVGIPRKGSVLFETKNGSVHEFKVC